MIRISNEEVFMHDDMAESIIEDLRAGEVSIVGSGVDDEEYEYYIEDILDTIEMMTKKSNRKVLLWFSVQCKDYAEREMPDIEDLMPGDQVDLELFDAQNYNLDDILDRTLEYYSMIDVLVLDCNGIIDYSKEKKSNKNLKALQVFAKEIKIPVLIFIPS